MFRDIWIELRHFVLHLRRPSLMFAHSQANIILLIGRIKKRIVESVYTRSALHFFFWVIMYLFVIYLKLPLLGLSFEKTAFLVIKDIGVIATIFYFISYYIIPRVLLKKKFLFLLGCLLLVYYFYATAIFLDFIFTPKIFELTARGYLDYSNRILSAGYRGILSFQNVAEILLDLSYLLSPALIVKLFITLLKLNMQALKLEKDNLNLELAFLKAQINPHFLFNTLNNVYSLALHKSDRTSDVVLKLSGLMRYTLYDSSIPKVPLNDEVNFFMNYIELERLRHSDRVKITFSMTGVYADLFIAPLIVFPFIENAFKHGINNSVKDSWVDVNLSAQGSTLFLVIRNSVFPHPPLSEDVGGIGVANSKKRLNLLYANKHTFEVKEDSNTFSVYLSINLR
jgi:two-component system LytT family sensor kinase